MEYHFIPKANGREHGAALIISLMVAVSLSLLIISTLEMVTSGIYIASNHKKYLQSLYMADAGIEDSIKELRSDPRWNAGFSNKSFEFGSYNVSIENRYPSDPLITITSTGTVNNNSVTIESQVEIIDIGSTEYLVKVIYWKEI